MPECRCPLDWPITKLMHDEHHTNCPKWLPLWRRNALRLKDEHGLRAVADKTGALRG